MSKSGRILIIEDQPNWQDVLKRTLTRDNFNVVVAPTFQDAVAKLRADFYHLAVIDIRLVDWDPENTQGMTVLDELKDMGLGDAMEKIMITAYGTLPQMRKAFGHHNVADFIDKSDFDREQFRDTVRRVFRDRIQIKFDLEIVLDNGLTYEELLNGVQIKGKRLNKDSLEMPRAVEETIDLLQRLFHNAKSIVVTQMGSHLDVRSAARVLRVQPYYTDRHGEAVIVKLGDHQIIDLEHSNFETYVKGFIGGSRATNVLNLEHTAWLGGIIYSLVGTGLENVDDFNAYYQSHQAEQVTAVLTNLFEHTCANWYADRGAVQHCRLTHDYLATLGYDQAGLEMTLKDNFPSLVNQKTITFREVSGNELINPVYAIKDRDWSRSTYKCVTHGDLNGGNILVDPSGETWLIDFANTGKNHILRDVIQLETVVKFQLLSSRDLSARAKLDLALNSMERFSQLDGLTYSPPDEEFEKAFKAVRHLRTIARNLVHPSDDFIDYYTGLLYMTLNILRFYGVHKINRMHALVSASQICERLGLTA